MTVSPRRLATILPATALLVALVGGAAEDRNDAPPRLPVPPTADLKSAERDIRELFRREYKQKSDLQKAALAKKLLELGGKTTTDPATRFVCWRESRDIAVGVVEMETALEAIKRLSDHYLIDGLAEKVSALTEAGRHADSAETRIKLAQGHLDVVAEARARDEYRTAKSAATSARRLARKAEAPNLIYKCGRIVDEVERLTKAYNGTRKSRATLETDPDDAAANLAVGRFHCMAKRDWKVGLPHLAKGDEERLAMVARADLDCPPTATDRAVVADMWWNLGERGDKYADAYNSRSAHLYESALPHLDGLDKERVEKRIEEYWREAGWQDALGLIDPEVDTFRGTWTWSDDGLTSSRHGEAAILSPAAPIGSYEFRVQFTRRSNKEAVYVDFPVADSVAHVAVSGWGGKFGGLLFIDGKDYRFNETKVTPSKIKNGRKYQFTIRVTVAGDSARIEVELDNAPYVRWEGEHKRISVPDAPRKHLIVFGSWHSETLFHKAEVRMTAGRFEIIERAAPKSG